MYGYALAYLVAPTTSVSMTINGPAPTVLAFFLNTAIDQQVDAFREREGREPDDDERAQLPTRATEQAIEQRQHESRCLSGSGLGEAQDVASLEPRRNSLRLNRCGL